MFHSGIGQLLERHKGQEDPLDPLSVEDISLSALPLEDSYHDDYDTVVIYPVETEIVFAGHSGSMSWWLLIVPVLIAVTRRFGI